jgi:hypothetical protein
MSSTFAWAFVNFTPDNKLKPKLCKNCIHYIPEKKTCSQFGKIDVVDGEVDNLGAFLARNDENLCGKKAKFFEAAFCTIEDNKFGECSGL